MKYYYIFLLFGILLSSCGHNCKTDCIDYGLDENCCPQVDSIVTNEKKSLIENVNIFLETSGSMVGYMPNSNPATDFQRIIPEILSSLNTEFPEIVDFYSIYKSNTPFEKLDLSDAREKILHGEFSWSGTTYLPKMLESITQEYQKTNGINIFITDGIYSPENKDKKEIELTETDIRSLISSFSKENSSSFYCLYSEFRGEKYPANKSPYYIIIQGTQENVNLLNSMINKSIDRLGLESNFLEFGVKYSNPFYSVFPYTETSANFIAMPCANFENAYLSIQEIDLKNSLDSLSFWVGIDLSILPKFTHSDAYLEKNLKFSINNGNVKMVKVQKLPYQSTDVDDIPIANKCTHLLKFQVTGFTECVSILELSLNYTRPDWINKLNEDNDENQRSKTFGLKKVISGFEQSYFPDDKKVLFENLQIVLTK
jgi:hypothetical protein